MSESEGPVEEQVDWKAKFYELEEIFLVERQLLDELAQATDDIVYNPVVVEHMKANNLTGFGMAAHRLLDRYRHLRKAGGAGT